MPALFRTSVAAAIFASAAIASPAAAQYAPPPYGYGQGWGPGEPIVRLNQYDGGTVNLRNGCIVTFNSYGTRLSSTRRCTNRMEARAREVFRMHQYGNAGRPGWGGGYGRPVVQWWGNAVRVDFPGVRCGYLYSRNGEHLQTIGDRCTDRMRAIANDAQTAFRRAGRW